MSVSLGKIRRVSAKRLESYIEIVKKLCDTHLESFKELDYFDDDIKEFENLINILGSIYEDPNKSDRSQDVFDIFVSMRAGTHKRLIR